LGITTDYVCLPTAYCVRQALFDFGLGLTFFWVLKLLFFRRFLSNGLVCGDCGDRTLVWLVAWVYRDSGLLALERAGVSYPPSASVLTGDAKPVGVGLRTATGSLKAVFGLQTGLARRQ
jgi:hypothetical protein